MSSWGVGCQCSTVEYEYGIVVLELVYDAFAQARSGADHGSTMSNSPAYLTAMNPFRTLRSTSLLPVSEIVIESCRERAGTDSGNVFLECSTAHSGCSFATAPTLREIAPGEASNGKCNCLPCSRTTQTCFGSPEWSPQMFILGHSPYHVMRILARCNICNNLAHRVGR